MARSRGKLTGEVRLRAVGYQIVGALDERKLTGEVRPAIPDPTAGAAP